MMSAGDSDLNRLKKMRAASMHTGIADRVKIMNIAAMYGHLPSLFGFGVSKNTINT